MEISISLQARVSWYMLFGFCRFKTQKGQVISADVKAVPLPFTAYLGEIVFKHMFLSVTIFI